METLNITKLIEKIRVFAIERDWEQYHTPKNISMALNVETSELLEIFQWLTAKESCDLKDNPEQLQKVKDEIADILVYVFRMVDLLGIDINEAIASKMVENAKKYPAEIVKGKAKKYNEY